MRAPPELVERAAAGEEILIAKSGRPRARLTAVSAPPVERRPGRVRGQIRIHDDFGTLPPEIGDAFGTTP